MRYPIWEFNTGTAMSPSSAERAAVRLSRRELEVARLVAQGLTNRAIADKLFISDRTVDGHLERVREKLGVSTRAQVAAWVVREGADPVVPAPSAPAGRPGPGLRLVAHPRLWIGTALVLALLAALVGVLRLASPAEPTIQTIAGSECVHQTYPGGCYGGDLDLATHAWLARPTDVAVDNNGLIYIADYGNQRVRLVDRTGRISTAAGGGTGRLKNGALATSVSLGYASSVAVDNQHRMYILTRADGVLELWQKDQVGYVTQLASLGRSPGEEGALGPNLPVGGLALAGNGTLYIADRAGNRVWILPAGGIPAVYAGTGELGFSGDGGAAEDGQLAWPIGLAVDKQGNLYIADARNNRIRKVDVAGRITTVAGSGPEGDSGDGGPAVRARLSFPFGVAVGPDGSFVIADTGNHEVRRITAGVISALAGTGPWGFAGDGLPASQSRLAGPEGVTFDASGNLFIADTENQRVREIALLSPAQH